MWRWLRLTHRTPHWVRWTHRTPHWGATARTSNEVRRATLGEELVEQLAEPGGLLEVHHVRGAGHAGMAGVRRFAFHEVRHREDVRRIQVAGHDERAGPEFRDAADRAQFGS